MCYTLFLFILAIFGIDSTLRSYIAVYTAQHKKYRTHILRIFLLFLIICVQGIFFSIPLVIIAYIWIFERKVTMEFFFPFFQTNIMEVKEFILGVLPFSVLLSVVCFLCAISYLQRDTIVYLGKKTTMYVGAISSCLLIALLVLNLQRHIVLYTLYRDAKEVYYKAPLTYSIYREENKKNVHITSNVPKKSLYIVVIGESATSVGWGAYGYYRETTPFISSNKENPNYILMHRTYTSELFTEQAVFYMLTNDNQYNTVDEKEVLSILDICKIAGYKTIWISNQGSYNTNATQVRSIAEEADVIVSDIKGQIEVEQYDEYILPTIARVLDEEVDEGATVIFVHLFGSHLRFHHRYDREKYSIFTDTPRNIDGKLKIDTINHYDNSIYATDDFLRRLTAMVEQRDDFKLLLYVSDHGEGAYQGVPRGNPLSIPDVIQVPFYLYISDAYREENRERVATLRTNSNRGYSTDMLFDTLLGLFSIQTDWYKAQFDISSPLYNYSYDVIKTISGKQYVRDILRKEKP